jgi:methylmalonyl-CoA carboxyltransferase large subunit
VASQATDTDRLAEALNGLRAELVLLRERVAALESAVAGNRAQDAVAAPAPPAQPAAGDTAAQHDCLDEELVFVISAAIAAFLGKKPHIRQIHVLRQDAWAQQGRVTMQASHRLAGTHH